MPLVILSCNPKTDHHKYRTDLDLNGLNGKVKKMEKQLYIAEVDSASGMLRRGTLFTVYTYEFNEKGYLTSFIEIHPSEDYTQAYEYDGKGYNIGFYRVELGDTFRDKCSLVLNDQGWMMKEIWLENGEDLLETYVNRHDANGNVIETSVYVPGKEGIQRRQEYIYDENGDRMETKYFDSQNTLVMHIVQRHDDNRQITGRTVSRLVGENWLSQKDEHHYQMLDEQNNWLRQISTYNLGDPLNQNYKWTERILEYY
jgi:hypothetical protein